MSTKKSIFTVLLFTAVFALASCASTPTVSDDLTPSQIVQLGQSAYDKGNYKVAIFYYEEVLSRFGTDPSISVEANYEIGHIYAKTNKKDNAKNYFNAVLELYDIYGLSLPQQYKKLSLMGLNSISN